MSARAAARLATLGFTNVYRYQAGRADWFAAGLPREGSDAHVPRVADVAKRDVQTCRPDERVGDVRDRVGRGGGEPLIVVDADRVVLGLVSSDALAGDPPVSVGGGMGSAPRAFRAHIR